jgi:hypothetical protein
MTPSIRNCFSSIQLALAVQARCVSVSLLAEGKEGTLRDVAFLRDVVGRAFEARAAPPAGMI